MQRDPLAQRVWYQWYQGYRGEQTHRVSGTKDCTCGTSRVVECREIHWHGECGSSGTKGTEGYQHIDPVVLNTMVPELKFHAFLNLSDSKDQSIIDKILSGNDKGNLTKQFLIRIFRVSDLD